VTTGVGGGHPERHGVVVSCSLLSLSRSGPGRVVDQDVSRRPLALGVLGSVPDQSLWDLGAGFLRILSFSRVSDIPTIIMLLTFPLPLLHIQSNGECR
jgi:hypothetical protein